MCDSSIAQVGPPVGIPRHGLIWWGSPRPSGAGNLNAVFIFPILFILSSCPNIPRPSAVDPRVRSTPRPSHLNHASILGSVFDAKSPSRQDAKTPRIQSGFFIRITRRIKGKCLALQHRHTRHNTQACFAYLPSSAPSAPQRFNLPAIESWTEPRQPDESALFFPGVLATWRLGNLARGKGQVATRMILMRSPCGAPVLPSRRDRVYSAQVTDGCRLSHLNR